MSLSTAPVEILGEIIFNLKDNRAALKSCSRTCKILLPICRQHIFRAINLNSQSETIICFGSLLNINPEIAGYVRELTFHFHAPDVGEDIPRTLNKLQQICIFSLSGPQVEWDNIEISLKQSLLRIIRSPSLNRLVLGPMHIFPFPTLIYCDNLTSLTLLGPISIQLIVEDQDKALPHKGALKLLDFDFLGHCQATAYFLFHLRLQEYEYIRILDFSSLRKLGCEITDGLERDAAMKILGCSEKLEVFKATIHEPSPGLYDFAQWLNPLARDTLKELTLTFILKHENEDPFVGHCEELELLSGLVALEAITVDCVITNSESSRELGSSKEWGQLSEVIRNGFPELRRFSMDIKVIIMVASMPKSAIRLKKKLERLPDRQLRWMSRHPNDNFQFHFSTTVKKVNSSGKEELLSSFEVDLC